MNFNQTTEATAECAKNSENLFTQLRAHAKAQGETAAILAPGRTPLTFDELAERIGALKVQLNELGVGRGDRVAVVMPNGPEMAVLYLTVAACATFVPLNPDFTQAEFEDNLERVNPSVVIAHADASAALRAACATRELPMFEVSTRADAIAGQFELIGRSLGPCRDDSWNQSDDNILILPTTGTTGRAKLVPTQLGTSLRCSAEMAEWFGLGPGDRGLHLMPMFHGHGLNSGFMFPLIAGSAMVCLSKFELATFFAAVDEFAPTWYSCAFTIHRAIVEGAADYRDIAERSCLRFIRSGSGRLDPTVMQGLEELFGAPVIERYGMTEAHTVTANPLPPRQRKAGTVGLPFFAEVAIRGSDGGRCPLGETGEVIVRSPTMFRGYIDDPELNAAVFEDGWFRTGDAGYLDEDGYLTITGRVNNMINRGGEKIGPFEVERVLARHPAVRDVCVFGVPHPSLGEEVIAAAVAESAGPALEKELQNLVRAELADFKTPKRIVFVENFPSGPTGKTDRKAVAELCQLEGNQARQTSKRVARTPLESALAGICASVLQIDSDIDPDSNFFMLGGDSLRAAEFIRAIDDLFGVELDIQLFFGELDTLARIAEFVDAERQRQSTIERGEPTTPVSANFPKGDPQTPSPLAPVERRIWLIEQLDADTVAYNNLRCHRLRGSLDRTALSRALDTILVRHEVLRSRFELRDGQLQRSIAPAEGWQLAYHDVDGTADEPEAVYERVLEEAHAPYDLAAGPLVRAALYRLADDDHVLAIGMHHIVTDARSSQIFAQELATVYNAVVAGETPNLRELPIQYADYARWENACIDTPEHKAQLAYWCEHLAGAPQMLPLPFDRSPAGNPSGRGERITRHLSRQTFDALAAIGRSVNATAFITLLATVKILLHRYTNETDIVVGSPISGRAHRDTESLIGFFLNTLLLRTDFSNDPTFTELVAQVRDTAAQAYANQSVTFDEIVEQMQPSRRPGRIPLHNVSFVFGSETFPPKLTGLEVEEKLLHTDSLKYDLQLRIIEEQGSSEFSITYDTALFDRATIQTMAQCFEVLVEAIAQNPQQRISALPLLTDSERQVLRHDWNQRAQGESPADCIHTMIEAQVARTPQAQAVVSGADSITYLEMNQAANRLAHYLRRAGITHEDLVGLSLPRSLDWVVAMLAVLKAGGAFVALNPADPVDRQSAICAAAGVRTAICQSAQEPAFAQAGAFTIDLVRDRDAIAAMPDSDPAIATTADRLAYVMYTSGSTGVPNGVLIEHRAFTNLIVWHNRTFDVSASDRVSAIASPAFDAALWEIFPYLSAGATVYVIGDETRLSPGDVIAFWRRHKIDVAWVPTALAELIVPVYEPGATQLRYLLTGGDQLRTRPPRDLGFKLVNTYGPTETTVTSTFSAPIEPDSKRPIPIGVPIDNARTYVLDDHLNPVPPGVAGELYIGGAGLARGYLNNPQLTGERFIADPFSDLPGARLYKTGDVVRSQPDGNLVFVGRRDAQISLRGYRIEPGEIAHIAQRHPDIAQCAVVGVPSADPERLHGFLVARSGRTIEPDTVRQFLCTHLPQHMVPADISVLEAMPLTANGKIDYKALRETRPAAPPRRDKVVRPRNPAEVQIIRIWHALFGRTDIGVTDNFFAVGGHSLMAAQLMSEIETIFGKRLALHVLWFGDGTVEDLARHLIADNRNKLWSEPIEIKKGNGWRPLFCVHVPGGILNDYAGLCARLPDEQTVYGLQAVGVDGTTPAHSDVETIADHCVSNIKKVQTTGPYRIAGYCAAGIYAYETARQLIAAGDEVEYLVMFDSTSPVARLRRRVRRELTSLVSPTGLSRMAARGTRVLAALLANPDASAPTSIGEAHLHSLQTYKPAAMPSHAVLYGAEANAVHRDVTEGWHELFQQGLELKMMPGDHTTMMQEPLVAQLAEHVTQDLARLDDGGR